MNQPREVTSRKTKIRRKARDQTTELSQSPPGQMNIDLGALNYEHEVQLAELKEQVKELVQTQKSLQDSLRRYQDLYNSAPIGYLSLDRQGLVIEANFTISNILGVETHNLIGTPFILYVALESQDIFELHSKKIFETGTEQKCELQLVKKDGNLVPVQLSGIPVLTPLDAVVQCRATVIDSSGRKELTAGLLNVNEEMFLRSRVLDMAYDTILLYSPDDRMLYANEAACRLYGYTREEFYRTKFSQLVPEEEMTSYRNRTRTILEKGEASSEVYHLRKDGHKVLVESHSRLVEAGGRKYIISVVRDITERKRMEEALKQSEALSSNIIQNSPYPVVVINPNLKIRYVNPAMEKLSGYTSAELIGQKSPYPWWPPEKQKEYQAEDVLKSKEEIPDREREYSKKNGEKFWVTLSIRKVMEKDNLKYFLASWVDITARKKAEDEIKQNELRLQSILEALTEGVALIAPDGKVIQANKAEARILGLKSLEERIGGHFRSPRRKIIRPDGSPMPLEETAIIIAQKRKKIVQNYETGLVKEDGTTIWLNVSAVPILNRWNQVIGIVRSMTDITEQKKLQDEREQFTRRLMDAQEEERKRISRDLHDDTAQYLALISLEIDSLIEQNKLLPPDTLSRLERLHNTTEKALYEVRRFSHELRPSILEDFGLPAALEQILSEFKNACKIKASFNIMGKERRLQNHIELALFRITQEAMNNIRKHSAATRAGINLKFTTQKVRLTVTDNGQGFTFRETDKNRTAGSLGLVGMRERAHLIGASLKIKSELNHGTVVSVELRT